MDTAKLGKQRGRTSDPPTVVPNDSPTLTVPQPAAPVVRITTAIAAAPPDLPEVFPHRWWRMGRHRLLCGPADQRFATHVPEAPVALWGLGASPATQTGEITPEWIARRATVVAVLLDNAALLTSRYPAECHYRRTVAALAPDVEEVREAWHPVVLFAREADELRIPDVLRLAADPLVDGALRADLAVQLLEHLTREGDPVIDPVLGDGATLLAAEATGRTCWGADPDPERCGRIIRAWERLTGETAVPSPVLSNRAA